jgi:spoIIIJ-associated protein
MDNTIQTEGETTQEAIDLALEQLGVGLDQVMVEVLEEPNKGLLGLRKGKAKVQVTVLDEEEIAKGAVEDIVAHIGAEASVETSKREDQLWISLSGDSLAWLIGRHGRTLDALQVVAGAIVNKKAKRSVKMVVDVEGYRDRRKTEVQALAQRAIGKVLATREPISLRPMSPIERKTVHLTVGEYEGVESMSAGSEPDRFVIISPK